MPERKFLTVFFSWGGHTRKAAKMITETTGGDQFELKPEKAYSKIYPICVTQAIPTAEAVLSARTISRSCAREMSTKALTEIT